MEEEITEGSVFIQPPMNICLFCGEDCSYGLSIDKRIMKIQPPESVGKWAHIECYMHFVLDEYIKQKLGE